MQRLTSLPTNLPTSSRRSLWLARLAVLLGAVEFLVRALGRVGANWLSDLAAPYTSSTLWLAGANPYNPFKFLSTWQTRGGPNLGLSDWVSGTHSVYPPPTLLLMAPLALLRWNSAVYLFVLIGLVFYAAAIYGLLRVGWPQHSCFANLAKEPMALFFIAFALGFAPVHTAFHSLNIVLIASGAAMLAVVTSIRGDAIAARSDAVQEALAKPRSLSVSKSAIVIGICVTAAILLKPTTGVFLLPWLMHNRRWRLIAAILFSCGVITALSLAPLVAHQGMSWLADYRENVSFLFTHGGNADVSPQNTENTDRIDLQLVAFALFPDRTFASASAALVYLVLLFLFSKRAAWRKPNAIPEPEIRHYGLPLLVAAGCLALGLLPSYTRMYAAIVLLPLILWCFTHLHFSSARWLLFLLSDFLLNTSAIVRKLGETVGIIVRSPRLWDLTLGGHTCWILLAIGIVLLWAMREQTSLAPKGLSAAAKDAVPVPLR
ncbi:hypothetical protein HDF16_001228 [Granulicella aggregans]|uniref:Uncharacterized protein n=1 Tax=Granulicella aggregans TaxID=474949 RepID=A0A7W7ZAZ2_9BACT|nr:hypothetical protein [Granulicella aggregans]